MFVPTQASGALGAFKANQNNVFLNVFTLKIEAPKVDKMPI